LFLVSFTTSFVTSTTVAVESERARILLSNGLFHSPTVKKDAAQAKEG
jgi:hypothetical protein